ncbi:MAG: hypothetical protein JXB30_00680 [Anaerolineae bacterium]|nr:hypothetical protein [Anaerolineae bacterium]
MQVDAERRAWRILVSFFIVFLLLCGSSIYLVQWYVFQSTIKMGANLKVARGTVRIILPNTHEAIAVTNERPNLEKGTIIQTDEKSQAILTLSDPRSGQPVASIVIFRDSEIILTRASAPRFGLNAAPYRIRFTSNPGRNEVSILRDNQRAVQIEANSPHAIMCTSESGLYTIETTNQHTRLMVRSGQATVIKKGTEEELTLSDDNRVVVNSANHEIETLPDEQPLVTNSTFKRSYKQDWIFQSDGEPTAFIRNVTFDSRPAVALDRSQSNWPDLELGHGETGLLQKMDANVNPFDSLELRATFYVDEQSLGVCGVEGSECALMIRISYTDINGTEQRFFHGFYARHDNDQGYPLLCNSCRQEHERIALKSWYTYSENLRTLLPADQQPFRINEVYFYASGHAYKVYVSEINLLGIQSTPPPDEAAMK